MNNIFLGSVPDSEFPLLNNERFTYEFLNINGKENIKYRFNWIDKGNIWEKRIEGANKDLTDKFKWVFENAMSTDYSYPQKSDSKLNKFFYTKFAVYDKEKINISI